MDNAYYAAVREKRQILRDIYGGMMDLKDLTRELGYKSPRATQSWISEVGLEGTKVGRGKRYETDLVARKLVDGRGMV